MKVTDQHTKTQAACFHCGDPCTPGTYTLDQKEFCCLGCQTVYQILSENDLEAYYDLEQHPGISPEFTPGLKRLEWLDDADVVDKLLDFQDEKQARITFSLPQIHCSSCIWLLEKLYRLQPGILHSEVNFPRKTLLVVYDKQVMTLRRLVEILSGIGYEPPLSLNDLSEEGKKPAADRKLIFQIGVAGFCFGNSMLLSFPEYLSSGAVLDTMWGQVFGYLNLLLALPVLLYSGSGYLKSAWISIRQKAINIDVPISLGILALFSRSAFEILTQTGAGYLDSMTGLVFFLLIGKWFQKRTYDSLKFDREYDSYFPLVATKIDGGEEKRTALHQLEPGDTLRIRDGELVPADSTLLSPEAAIDYSFVTGESRPAKVDQGAHLYAGGRVKGPKIEVSITKKVSQSYLTQLWDHEAFRKETGQHMQYLADRLGKYFTPSVLVIAALAGAYWLQTGPAEALHVFTSVLIIACPCALALASPFILGNAMRMLSRKGLFLKNTQAVERMARINRVVWDKTGTLTHSSAAGATYTGPALSKEEKEMIGSLVAQSPHPVSQAIAAALSPFNTSEVLGFVSYAGLGIAGWIEGEEVLVGSGKFIRERVPGFEIPEGEGSWAMLGGKLLGRFSLPNTVRPETGKVIDELGESYSQALVSGDDPTAGSFWKEVFPPDAPVHFGTSPHEKLGLVKSFQEKGETVMMIGDGLNDAGALKQSEVGVSLVADINHFAPSCDAILDERSFSLIPNFMQYTKVSVTLVKTGFVLSLLYNLIGLGFAVQGLLSPVVAAILMPLSSISIVGFALASTSLAARLYLKGDKSHSGP